MDLTSSVYTESENILAAWNKEESLKVSSLLFAGVCILWCGF